eukprot:12882836-Prorocentrum_lima.AAC.1
MFLKKPIDVLASDERLLRNIRPLHCDVRHQHIPIKGGRAHPAIIWTWEFASRAVAGVAAVVRGHHNEKHDAS